MAEPRTGGRILVDNLLAQGADTVFCVPGESYLAVLDALYDHRDRIRVITCRHEAAAANMAVAYGKLTGRPGICFVTRGPGATQASVGVHTARQDWAPMILFIGQVPRRQRGRQSFQEVDLVAMFTPLANLAVEIDEPERLPEIVALAHRRATGARPGPVVVALPEDVTTATARAVDLGPTLAPRSVPDPRALARALELLSQARRPLVLAGGPGWSASTSARLARLATSLRLPVAATVRAQDLLDNRHPAYVGSLGLGMSGSLARRVRDADLLIALGTPLDDLSNRDYELIHAPRPVQRLIHVLPEAAELGRVYQADLPIAGEVDAFLEAALESVSGDGSGWREWSELARAEYLAGLEPRPAAGAVNLGVVVAELSLELPEDTIITAGAGNYNSWLFRGFQFKRPGTLCAPVSGAMGFGVPAALSAALLHPDRQVVCFAGDGDFLMAAQELATAIQYGLRMVVVVVDNGTLGTIRMHQEREYPGRVIATDLVNPDFAALARAFGAHGETVRRTEDFLPAFRRAAGSGRPAVIDLITDPEDISVGMTLSSLRAQGTSGSEPEAARDDLVHDLVGTPADAEDAGVAVVHLDL